MAATMDDHSIDTVIEALRRLDQLVAAETEAAVRGEAYLEQRDRQAIVLARRALRGLASLYVEHGLDEVSDDSAADQCASLYQLLGRLGMEVA